jgi:HD-GYP domain-containing protein (c-di-GMP phosphodiesterase class II)
MPQPPGEQGRHLRQAIVSLKEAIEARDRYTMGHSTRVRGYAVAIAIEMGLDLSAIREIALGAELHDVGKIGVPDELLHKPGALAPEEHRRVLEHTVIGERILAPILRDHPVVLAIVRSHHEWVDGSGYPDRLCGEAIPLVARILAVADAFDAMTSTRPYRSALSFATALREMRRCTGTQFDARCVRALLAVLARVPGSRGIMQRPLERVSRVVVVRGEGSRCLESSVSVAGRRVAAQRAGLGAGEQDMPPPCVIAG